VMTAESVTFVQGGFTPIGGIETFAADFLSTLRARGAKCELICWNASRSNGNPTLKSLAKCGVTISSSTWRWGCRWGWPDSLMVSQHWQRLASARILIFGKVLHERSQRRLRALGKRMILITPYRPAEMWRDRCPDREMLNSFDSISVQAKSFEGDLREFGFEGRINYLPYLPPDTDDVAPWPESSTLRVGFLGRLVPDKNVEYLVRSFSHLSNMDIEAQLHIFGDGPDKQALEALASRLLLRESIVFHGSVDRSRIAAAIDSCHLFAFSSRTEGQPVASLEALARGRPVVGTPVGSFPEYLNGALGAIAPEGNPIAYAATLKSMAEPIFCGRLSPKDVQRAYKRRFSRSKVIDAYMEMFRSFD